MLPGAVTSTYDEIQRVREYSVARGLRSILIVTSAYHSRRAWWTVGQVFRDSNVAIGLDVAAPGEQTPRPATWWLHRFGWKLVPGEYVKIIYYRWKY